MELLFVSSKVESRIAALEKAGKHGKTLAQKATGIIDSLASGDVRSHMDMVGSYTKYGEKRIKNCRKYDLGCGYRLITLQRGSCVVVPFFGTHDECQRWLENNSRMKVFNPGKGTWVCIEEKCVYSGNRNGSNSADTSENMEDEPDIELSDRDLRVVFSGLVKGLSKRV